ncbi:MAG: tetratricopeptide repeat protein [Burkholderiales bacterium]|nr:tetratricopeptide repeat protein [Burkholderiales bacterium]
MAAGLLVFLHAMAGAAEADLPRARQLLADGQYPQAYQLLQPLQATTRDDAAFNLLLGEAALRTGRADEARALFAAALALQPGSIEAHLGLGRAYLARGDYARAKIEFETVLRFDDLPPDLESQAEIYADAARAYAEGRRLLASGYALLGYGNYRIGASGGGPRNDAFFAARVGGRLNVERDDAYALVGSLDYRFRDYDAEGRRNDSDLRWNGAVSRNVGEGNWIAGLRGRVSYRGDSTYRNDFGAYGQYRLRLDEDNQVSAGLEVRQRRYPTGRLRERTRNIVEATAGWTHSMLDGKASVSLDGQAGREFNTERPDGDANFFGLSPSVNFSITENLGGFAFFWWQNDRYNIERLGQPGDSLVGIGTRNDNLYEVGGGLTWQFLPNWSLNPEILYIRDSSNILAANYSSTEIWITLRVDF